MYEYKKKLDRYFKDRYGKEIITLKPVITFEESVFSTIKKQDSERLGWIKGLPNPLAGVCLWRRDAKIRPVHRFLKQFPKETTFTNYIGYTFGETRSIVNDDDHNITFEYPLKDIYKMTEQDCLIYMREKEMENPLYKLFTRTGCGGCQAQGDMAWYQVWKHFPDYWKFMKDIEARLQYYIKQGFKVINPYWFEGNRTTQQMEFMFKHTSNPMMDFSDEPLKDCFCKI